MATGTFSLDFSPSTTFDELHKFCHKCKQLLPISIFMKDCKELKTCSNCRDSTQVLRRSRRRQLAAINAQLTGDPHLNRMVYENSNRGPDAPVEIVPRTIYTDITYNPIFTKQHMPISPYISSALTESTIQQATLSVTETQDILAVTENAQKKFCDVQRCVRKVLITQNRQPSAHSDENTSDISIGKSTESDSVSCVSDLSDQADTEISEPSYFVCMHCGTARSIGLDYDGVCVYCYEGEQKFCVYGEHEMRRDAFFDLDGNENEVCNTCLVAEEEEIEVSAE